MLKIGVFPEDIIDSHIAPTSGKARHDRDDAIEKRAHRSQKCTSRAFRASNAPLPVRDPTKNESFLFPEEEIFDDTRAPKCVSRLDEIALGNRPEAHVPLSPRAELSS